MRDYDYWPSAEPLPTMSFDRNVSNDVGGDDGDFVILLPLSCYSTQNSVTAQIVLNFDDL